jgi:hypothetical protein
VVNSMSDPLIHDLGMTDTEYTVLVAKGYEPVLEHQLIAIGEDPSQARRLTKLAGLVQCHHDYHPWWRQGRGRQVHSSDQSSNL